MTSHDNNLGDNVTPSTSNLRLPVLSKQATELELFLVIPQAPVSPVPNVYSMVVLVVIGNLQAVQRS